MAWATTPGRVRQAARAGPAGCQPAQEVAGGALDVMAAGSITSVDRICALHCDPWLDVGKVGVRTGPVTGACDKIRVQVSGPGGHTARPHLTRACHGAGAAKVPAPAAVAGPATA